MSGKENEGNLPQIPPQQGEWIPASAGGGGGTFLEGFKAGLHVGVQYGFDEAINQVREILPELIQHELMNLPDLRRALSDGLRHGSPGCGQALVNIYRYGKNGYTRLN